MFLWLTFCLKKLIHLNMSKIYSQADHQNPLEFKIYKPKLFKEKIKNKHLWHLSETRSQPKSHVLNVARLLHHFSTKEFAMTLVWICVICIQIEKLHMVRDIFGKVHRNFVKHTSCFLHSKNVFVSFVAKHSFASHFSEKHSFVSHFPADICKCIKSANTTRHWGWPI